MAAALIPLVFILGLLTLFATGAWSMGWFPSIAVTGLLVFIAVVLVRMIKSDEAAGQH